MSIRTADRRWRQLRQRFIDAQEDHRCSSCGRQLNPLAKPTEYNAITVDHIKSYHHFPELWLDWDNLTLLCRACNSAKREGYGARARQANNKVEQKRWYNTTVWLRWNSDHQIWHWHGGVQWSDAWDRQVVWNAEGEIVEVLGGLPG